MITGGLVFVVFIAILALVVITGLGVMGIYNRLVSLRNRFKNAFSQIDVQLQRRHDLIPNLVETAKGYLKHERGTLEAVIAARNASAGARQTAAQHPENADNIKNLIATESALTGTLSKLFALAEAYPDLKANQTMLKLMEELASTENKVAFARQAFNDSVMVYNTARETFPNNLVSGLFNFAAAELFEITNPQIKEAPQVAF